MTAFPDSIPHTAQAYRAIALCCVAAVGSPFAGKNTAHCTHEILRTIRAPDQLTAHVMPVSYHVPVSLSGPIAVEIITALERLGCEPPHYEELKDSRGAFHLKLANTNYSLETREMISGMLNPAEVMEITINSVIRYRDPKLFKRLSGETSIACTTASREGRTVYRIALAPKGRRFCYAYEDKGSYVRESWIDSLSLVMDSSSHIIYELAQRKFGRVVGLQESEKAELDTAIVRYCFSYDIRDSVTLPRRLELFINDTLFLTLEASYRPQGRYLVFDSRTICYNDRESALSCLSMKYGDYRFEPVRRKDIKPARQEHYSRDINKAAELSRDAVAELKNGRIHDAVRLLQKIVRQYPHTPQAVEARRLLSSLPRAF